MQVTNDDLKGVSNAICLLTVKILRTSSCEESVKATRDRELLVDLEKKLRNEFSISEFPEMKEPL